MLSAWSFHLGVELESEQMTSPVKETARQGYREEYYRRAMEIVSGKTECSLTWVSRTTFAAVQGRPRGNDRPRRASVPAAFQGKPTERVHQTAPPGAFFFSWIFSPADVIARVMLMLYRSIAYYMLIRHSAGGAYPLRYRAFTGPGSFQMGLMGYQMGRTGYFHGPRNGTYRIRNFSKRTFGIRIYL